MRLNERLFDQFVEADTDLGTFKTTYYKLSILWDEIQALEDKAAKYDELMKANPSLVDKAANWDRLVNADKRFAELAEALKAYATLQGALNE